MLWYKSWLETRWRFLIGLALLFCSAAASVAMYPEVVKLLPLVPQDVGGEIGRKIREAAELSRSYRGYIWTNWFRQNLLQMATLFAILLGTAGVLSQSGGALFTLSLPVSRHRILGTRAATGLAELFALAFLPTLLIPLLSPAVGESYSVAQALVHSVCLFIAASMFFMLALLLSTIFSDPWSPLLIALAVAFGLAFLDFVFRLETFSVYRAMSGETWFRNGRLPWEALLTSAALASAFYAGAVRNLARRDF